MRLYLLRHGETKLNKMNCYYGVTDVPLSETGKQQGLALARYFKEVSVDAVIASPLRRAISTAELVMQGTGPAIRTDRRLMEQDFGIFEGLQYQEILEKYPEEFRLWNEDFSDYNIPGGESFRNVRERIDSFIGDLPKEGTVLIAAHKGTLGHLTASLLGLPLNGYWNFVFEQDSYSCIDVEDGYAIVRCLNRKTPLY